MLKNKRIASLALALVFVLAVDVVNGDYTFGTPINLGQPVNSSSNDWGPCLSADGLELYFGSGRHGGSGEEDL